MTISGTQWQSWHSAALGSTQRQSISDEGGHQIHSAAIYSAATHGKPVARSHREGADSKLSVARDVGHVFQQRDHEAEKAKEADGRPAAKRQRRPA